MHKNSVKIFIFSIIVFSIILISRQKPITSMVVVKKVPFKYLFFQQINPLCTIAPMLNRRKLQALKELGQNYIEQAFDNPELALTRQQWFGESHQYLFAWRKFLTEFMHTEVGRNFLQKAAQNGLVTPHFYIQSGTQFFQLDKEAIDRLPYFFADTNFAGNIDAGTSFSVPIVSPFYLQNTDFLTEASDKRACLPIDERTDEDSGWLIYNKETKKFENFSYIKLQDDPIFSSIKASVVPYQAHPQNLITYFNSAAIPNGQIGFKALTFSHQDWSADFEGKMPYCLGFLKLMFLVLGINNDNNQMTVHGDPEEYPVHVKIKELIQADSDNNPWSDNFFKKEYFIQYALAEIFKNNQELFDKARKIVDFAEKLWQPYDDVISGRLLLYKNAQGTPYNQEEIIRYLPGRHQALAYFFTQVLRYLWYGAASVNASAFYKSLYIEDTPSLLLWWNNMSFSQIKRKADKKNDGISFLSVWDDIKNELQRRHSNIQDWVSFDDHGWVISFDPQLIGMQRSVAQQKHCDYQFLDRLGFAGIESWWGHELETFYKR